MEVKSWIFLTSIGVFYRSDDLYYYACSVQNIHPAVLPADISLKGVSDNMPNDRCSHHCLYNCVPIPYTFPVYAGGIHLGRVAESFQR